MKKAQPDRIISGEKTLDDSQSPAALRPRSMDQFIGQAKACSNLKVFIDAARSRGQPLDHVLLCGPPGLGKTTLAHIVAAELGVGFRATSAPMITKAGDLAAILTNLEPRDVLFIDEIHRLGAHIEEVLYSAMEDFQLDLIIGEGPAARSVRIDIPPFTLVGATTRAGLLSHPLRDRFGIPLRLDFYSVKDLGVIIARAAGLLDFKLADDAVGEIAARRRGTPRIAGRLLRRVRDFIAVKGGKADKAAVDHALLRLNVDKAGLDEMDRKYLGVLAQNYGGGPVGAETLAAALAEERDTIEEVIEPFLLQQGLIQRTPRGRVLSAAGYDYLGLKPAGAQGTLL
ncbi:MAG: Holliday junction branch migration DNA helicase RuvB [Alphaproteobacteria bacterium]|nr:Holliday junction branch migration DNA helicase RuvB [Alphaproteobacteria bacterium]